MAAPRTWQREARLLLTVAELDHRGLGAAINDVAAVDFLLQHPLALMQFATRDTDQWPSSVLPTQDEADSAEETFLRWKRSVAQRVVAPLVGRLIGRGLVTRTPQQTLVLTDLGEEIQEQLRAFLADDYGERLVRLGAEFSADSRGASLRLDQAIEGVRT